LIIPLKRSLEKKKRERRKKHGIPAEMTYQEPKTCSWKEAKTKPLFRLDNPDTYYTPDLYPGGIGKEILRRRNKEKDPVEFPWKCGVLTERGDQFVADLKQDILKYLACREAMCQAFQDAIDRATRTRNEKRREQYSLQAVEIQRHLQEIDRSIQGLYEYVQGCDRNPRKHPSWLRLVNLWSQKDVNSRCPFPWQSRRTATSTVGRGR
jgi:hypothetical protein